MPKINPKNRAMTDAYRFNNCYVIMERQRDALKRMWAEMPMDQLAVLTSDEAAEYLGTSRVTLARWAHRGVLVPIVLPGKRGNRYMAGHLWVFKTAVLENDSEKESTA